MPQDLHAITHKELHNLRTMEIRFRVAETIFLVLLMLANIVALVQLSNIANDANNNTEEIKSFLLCINQKSPTERDVAPYNDCKTKTSEIH